MKSQTKQQSIVGDVIKKALDVLLYSNIWMAFCALCLCSQTQLLLHGDIALTPVVLCTTCGVFVIYGLHRWVGLSRLKTGEPNSKFLVIYRLRYWIAGTTGLGVIGLAISITQMSLTLLSLFSVPGIVALAYVVPIKNGKRLRDMGLVKIFALTLTWAWLTTVVPALEQQESPKLALAWMFIERLLFLFAIAMAFDMRDINIDQHYEVKTLPQYFGLDKSKVAACFSLIGMVAFASINAIRGTYSLCQLSALCASAFGTAWLIANIHKDSTEYYYSGLIDGMLPLQLLLIIVGQKFC